MKRGAQTKATTGPTRGKLLPVGDDGCHGDLPRHNPLSTTTGRTSEDGGKLGVGVPVAGVPRYPGRNLPAGGVPRVARYPGSTRSQGSNFRRDLPSVQSVQIHKACTFLTHSRQQNAVFLDRLSLYCTCLVNANS
eukprot:2742760-Rhodomonas_salina.2